MLAALSSEMYMTHDEDDPLPARVAAFIESELMRGEVAGAIFRLATQGLELSPDVAGDLRAIYGELVAAYVTGLAGARAQRPGEFRRKVLRPFQRAVRPHLHPSAVARFRSRLLPGNVHLAGLITTFFDYATLAADFRSAHVAEIEQVSGARQSFYVVRMPAGRPQAADVRPDRAHRGRRRPRASTSSSSRPGRAPAGTCSSPMC